MSETEAIVAVMLTGMLFGIPMLGLTLRFSLKPLLEAYIRLREAQLTSPQVRMLHERVAYLERELERRGVLAPQSSVLSRLEAAEPLPLPLKERERV
jgi:hypothetical protein